MKHLKHILQLGVKELLSLLRDPVLLFLIVYSFTFSVYTPSQSAVMDVINASVAVVDEDHSAASRQIRDALL
ncbi:MAG: ABC transporter permease, partial [Candidatus Binataceae bacterium]